MSSSIEYSKLNNRKARMALEAGLMLQETTI